MAIPIINFWKKYYDNPDEGLGSSYERIIIHNKILEIANKYGVKSVLEVPSFGFTGTSGINSMGLAYEGMKVSLVDHDQERLDLINRVWQESNLEAKLVYLEKYSSIPFEDNSFDMSWNFSALWFVNDLKQFLKELTRVTSKVVILAVPNRSGLGYLSQKYLGKEDLNKYLKEENIIPRNFIKVMNDLGWKKISNGYFDCPPWPDIGMAKEDFLKKLGLGFLVKNQPVNEEKDPLTVLDYWQDKDKDFASKMMNYYWLEKIAPDSFKAIWAHHKYYVFRQRLR